MKEQKFHQKSNALRALIYDRNSLEPTVIYVEYWYTDEFISWEF